MKMFSPNQNQLTRLSLTALAFFLTLIIVQKIQAVPVMQAASSPDMFNQGDESPALSVGSTTSATYNWETMVVEDVKAFSSLHPQALQVDGNGRPHIVYGGDHLYYAWSIGTIWYHETIDATDGVGRQAILALDSTGSPHVLYRHSVTSSLHYAYKVNGTWLVETVSPSAEGYSLALDNQDRPHIAYVDASRTLTYAYRQAGTWISEEVTTGTRYGISLAVDSQNKPHITVGVYDEDSIRYIHQSNSDWTIETIPNPVATYVDWTFLTLTSDDQPRIAVSIPDPWIGGFYYYYPENNEWVVERIGSSYISIYNLWAMALDSQGDPHLLVGGAEIGWGYRVLYLERVAGVWVQIDTNIIPDKGYGVSLALDVNDQPYIAYYQYPTSCNDCGEKILTYDYQIGDVWQTEFIDRGGIVSVRPAMALDHAGNMHIAYSAAGRVRYARWAGGRWELETIEANASQLWSWNQLIIDTQNTPHFLYYDEDGSALKYAYRNAGTWVVHLVAQNVSPYSYSLAVNDAGEPAIVYYQGMDGSIGEIHYAFRNGTSWIDEVVGPFAPVGQNLVLNSNGTPHFVYYFEDSVYYTWRTPTGWQSEVITRPPDTYNKCHSLVLDSNEQPHLLCDQGYQGWGQTFYAYKQGDNWVLEYIPESNQLFSNPRVLILDSENNPHNALAYDDSAEYFHKADGNWEFTEFIFQLGCCYRGLDGLFLDELDQPHLVYQDTSTHHQYKVGESWVEELIPDVDTTEAVMIKDENSMPFFTRLDAYGSPLGKWLSVRHQLKTLTAAIPVTGGTISTPDATTTLVFPSGAFSTTAQVTLTFTDTFILQGDLWGNGYNVAVTAVDANTNEPISLLPGQTFTMSVMYRHYPPAREESLALYTWNGGQWAAETSSVLQMPNHLIMAAPAHLGQFAILGDTLTTYLPVILHYPLRE